MRDIHKTGHPLFVVCVAILILNDWYLKVTFHNDLTGKLSDFAGLFAFPYLLSALFPPKTLKIHIATGLFFIIWKSEFSQPIIDLISRFNIPVDRTVDVTDNIALLSVFVSYFTLKSSFAVTIKPIYQKALIVVACFSFIATTLPPHKQRKFAEINKEYQFDFSKRELVSRINMVQLKEIRDLNKLSGAIDFDSKRNVFHYQDQTDTLALLLDYQKITDLDTIKFKTSFAEIQISGNETNSSLKLLTVYKLVPAINEKDYREKAIKQFEKKVVKKIKSYR